MSFFNSLNFTSANEDGRTELAALTGQKPRRLLCLTGSGGRALDMLLGDAKEIIALDLNPAQNHLLRLKIAAIQTLSDSELPAYLGVTESADRLRLHERVRPALAETSRTFWDSRREVIASGVWNAGLWERVLRFGARLSRMARGKNIDKLFAAASLEEQASIWADKFDDWLWRGSIRLLGRKFVWTRLVGEPGGNFLPTPGVVEARLAGAFNHAARTFFFRESDFASLILRGRHLLPDAVPLHMMPENLDKVRNGLARIRVVEGGLTDLHRLGIQEIDAFSLSDFGSYCDQRAYDACWASIREAAANGARVCEREFMNRLKPFPDLTIDSALSETLTRNDRSFIYRITAGTLP